MVSIRECIHGGKTVRSGKNAARIAVFLFVAFFSVFPLKAQTPTSLAAEIERLEQESMRPAGRREALKSLARLYQLSGNPEKALEAWTAAAVVSESANAASAARLEASRLLISLGEYEKAAAELKALSPAGSTARVRLTLAQIDAFARQDTQALVQLTADSTCASYRSEIYYTLWKLTAADSWKARLLAECPQSPEARIASANAAVSGGISPAATPQWLLFPGRSAIGELSAVIAAAETSRQQSPASRGTSNGSIPSGSIPQATFLQTNLFSREANAKTFAERLEKAGFRPRVIRRQINGRDHWAVVVDAGESMNRTIQELKNAGFESFPVFE